MKRKLIDERGLIFGKLSVVDILAVLVVLALGAMVYVRFFSGGEGSVVVDDQADVSYTVRVSNVRSMTFDALREGDTVYNEEGAVMGTITGLRSEPHLEKTNTLDGRVVDMPKENYLDIYITIEARCSLSGGRYYVNGAYELNVNEPFPMTTRYAATSGTVYSVG